MSPQEFVTWSPIVTSQSDMNGEGLAGWLGKAGAVVLARD